MLSVVTDFFGRWWGGGGGGLFPQNGQSLPTNACQRLCVSSENFWKPFEMFQKRSICKLCHFLGN